MKSINFRKLLSFPKRFSNNWATRNSSKFFVFWKILNFNITYDQCLTFQKSRLSLRINLNFARSITKPRFLLSIIFNAVSCCSFLLFSVMLLERIFNEAFWKSLGHVSKNDRPSSPVLYALNTFQVIPEVNDRSSGRFIDPRPLVPSWHRNFNKQ